MSVALKLAWDKARRSEYYWNVPERVKRPRKERVITSAMADAISSFYASSAYQGD